MQLCRSSCLRLCAGATGLLLRRLGLLLLEVRLRTAPHHLSLLHRPCRSLQRLPRERFSPLAHSVRHRDLQSMSGFGVERTYRGRHRTAELTNLSLRFRSAYYYFSDVPLPSASGPSSSASNSVGSEGDGVAIRLRLAGVKPNSEAIRMISSPEISSPGCSSLPLQSCSTEDRP